MRIGIIGNGVVGGALARAYKTKGHDVRVYDVLPERSTHSLPAALEGELIFICLPTPATTDGDLNTRAIADFLGGHAGYQKNFVIKSTVPIGFTRAAASVYDLPNLVHSPEFLTGRVAYEDALAPRSFVIGTDRRASDCVEKLLGLYVHAHHGAIVRVMSPNESEAVKLFTNAFFATKVALMNELWTVAKHFSLDWDKVVDGMLDDGRINPAHTQVPGPDGQFGFGGSCLPKDTNHLIGQMSLCGLIPSVLSAAVARNCLDRQRKV